MSPAPQWSGPEEIAATEPRSPYAHFAFQDHRAAKRENEAEREKAAEREPSAAPRCYHSCYGCLVLRYEAGKGVRVDTVKTDGISDELAAQLGPLDRIVGIQLPHYVVNQNLATLGGASAGPTKSGPDWPPEEIPDWPKEIPPPGSDRPPVFIGIVDDAIAFAHRRFRLQNDDSTRFDYLWLQGVPHTGDPVPFGRLLDRSAINDLLRDQRDEAAIYREVGLIDMSRPTLQHAAQAFSHGTAVLDVAAGYAQDDPRGAARPIAAVCLPSEVTSDTLGSFAEVYVILAIERLLAHLKLRRERAGGTVPAVINISLALTGGPKDGSSLLDHYLATTAEAYKPLWYVLPAGNHRLGRCHAHFDTKGQRTFEVTWRLPPEDLTPSFLEIWGPPRAKTAPSLRLSLRLPNSPAPLPVHDLAFDTYRRLSTGGHDLAWVYCQWVEAPEGGDGRERLTVVTFPTRAPLDRPVAPAGDWRIEVDVGPDAPLPIDLYIQRDDTIPGFRRRGRQSFFVDLGYSDRQPNGFPKLDDRGERSLIRRAGTISSFAAGETQVVVGGQYVSSRREVDYSGAPEIRQPAVTEFAPAERSRVVGGIIAAGSRSGSRVAIGGTSVAAAAVTRRLADEQAGGAATRAAAQTA